MSTIKHSALIMMLDVVASNGEKMSPVFFKEGYRLTSAVHKEILETKILSRVKIITESSLRLLAGRIVATYGKDYEGLVERQHEP